MLHRLDEIDGEGSEFGGDTPRPSESRDLRPGSSSRKSAHLQNHGAPAGRGSSIAAHAMTLVSQGCKATELDPIYSCRSGNRTSTFRRCGTSGRFDHPFISPSIGCPTVRRAPAGGVFQVAPPSCLPCHQPGPQTPLNSFPIITAGQ